MNLCHFITFEFNNMLIASATALDGCISHRRQGRLCLFNGLAANDR